MWFGLGTTDAAPPRPETVVTASIPGTSITVHVSGAVRDPGVVIVPSDSRVMDVVIAAGGATPAADLGQLNLAAAVRDGERVIVPFEGAVAIKAPGDGGVDINSATVAGLEELPGVGPVLAARIVAYRDEHGPFTEVEDLLGVAGIGEAKLAGMRDDISSP